MNGFSKIEIDNHSYWAGIFHYTSIYTIVMLIILLALMMIFFNEQRFFDENNMV